jgi:hypothetical protein
VSAEPSLILLTRPGCHLCDGVREPLATLARLHGLHLDELSVESDPQREEQFGQRIPVLLWGSVVVGEGRFSPEEAIARVVQPDAGLTIR